MLARLIPHLSDYHSGLNKCQVSYLFFSVLLCLSACSKQLAQTDTSVISGLTMGTTYTVKINQELDDITENKLRVDIEIILDDINQKMSTYLSDSELSQINQLNSHKWIPVSDELFEVLQQAINVSDMTDGAYDITVGPIVNLFGFGPDNKPQTFPSNETIQQFKKRIGYHHLQLRDSPKAIKKNLPDLYLDLSGIAKGYAADMVAEYLKVNLIKNFMVEIGGEIKAQGINSEGIAWQIGIEKPVTDRRTVQRIIQLADIGMATSGNYRNYYELDDVLYNHTIDPETGLPTSHALASVTVLHPSTTIADALATGLLVSGPETGHALAIREKIAALFIIRTDKGYEEHYTDEFKPYLLGEE